jgi:hypothetical protein
MEQLRPAALRPGRRDRGKPDGGARAAEHSLPLTGIEPTGSLKNCARLVVLMTLLVDRVHRRLYQSFGRRDLLGRTKQTRSSAASTDEAEGEAESSLLKPALIM